ncbi:hypothetical protein ACFLVS_05340 [Chloroflexota bacterium]
MPRKKEPSFKVKTIIWDKAVTTGKKPEVILRELENELRRLYKEEDFYEEAPEVRTIKRIIEEDINLLSPEVVIVKLPPHVWHLRNDYESIKSLAKNTLRKSPLPKDQAMAALIIASNLEKIRNAPAQSLGDPFGHTVYTIGDNVYGGWWVNEDQAKLGDVDGKVAAELLNRLKEEGEFTELSNISDWAELEEDDNTEDLIQRLISRAHRGNF